jgi:hypothetical protein
MIPRLLCFHSQRWRSIWCHWSGSFSHQIDEKTILVSFVGKRLSTKSITDKCVETGRSQPTAFFRETHHHRAVTFTSPNHYSPFSNEDRFIIAEHFFQCLPGLKHEEVSKLDDDSWISYLTSYLIQRKWHPGEKTLDQQTFRSDVFVECHLWMKTNSQFLPIIGNEVNDGNTLADHSVSDVNVLSCEDSNCDCGIFEFKSPISALFHDVDCRQWFIDGEGSTLYAVSGCKLYVMTCLHIVKLFL